MNTHGLLATDGNMINPENAYGFWLLRNGDVVPVYGQCGHCNVANEIGYDNTYSAIQHGLIRGLLVMSSLFVVHHPDISPTRRQMETIELARELFGRLDIEISEDGYRD